MNASRAPLAFALVLAGALVPLACTLGTSGTLDSATTGAGAGSPTLTGVGGGGGSSTTTTGMGGASATTTTSTATSSTSTSATSSTSSAGGAGGGGDLGGAGGAGGGGAVCGDLAVTPPEECDDGNTAPGDGCSPSCMLEHPDGCPGTTITAGYGTVTLSGDTTGASDDDAASCGGDGAPDFVYAVTPVGDGTLDVAVTGTNAIAYVRAACDPMAQELACGADAKLIVKAGTTYFVYVDGQGDGDEGAFTATVTLSPCGNGKLDPGEECDDANVADGDGCNACVVDCEGDHPFEDPATKHCYDYVQSWKNWSSAESACVGWGGHLVAISSDAEKAVIDAQSFSSDVWIGGTDSANEGTFVWTNGEPWGFTSWNSGEPNDTWPGEDCLMQYQDGTWNDDGCGWLHDYVCERPPPVAMP